MDKYEDSKVFLAIVLVFGVLAAVSGVWWVFGIAAVLYALHLVFSVIPKVLAEEWELLKFTIANWGK